MEDISILVLLFKLGCSANPPGQLKQTEWCTGCLALNPAVDSWESLKLLVVPAMDTGFMDATEFRDFYKFCFQFNLSGTHRTLDKELVVALLPMVLQNRLKTDRLESFIEFLVADETLYSRITLDQWTSFLDFCLEVQDLEQYDETTSAWPVLIDEYVEYMEAKAKQKK
jgi:thiol-disulfide isomerase/thioredoxin